MLSRPPTPPLFPYTTLFRSLSWTNDPRSRSVSSQTTCRLRNVCSAARAVAASVSTSPAARSTSNSLPRTAPAEFDVDRSEEHTSELQSRQYLVCRLLLEKKK